ncbi:MBL fold metallo-hydrolase [Francisella uliginis]|uniref:Metallo-beta-lactamase domain-containing protein n=1 Tax=Francisella uliginis TaxID=573570 RepID=A0A1L4BRT4_9GAMM|nr:MBL fold metallo-hydrolase [Francisella uliginis]API86545.1 hypothetical protein F7310_03885 [Francisella uliginis]
MKLQKISKSCYAIINEKNRMCDANSGFINLGGGVLIDTQSDTRHAQMMMDLLSPISKEHPKFIVNTHEDCDHVFGNQLFRNSEIIAHKSVPERMKLVANPEHMKAPLENDKNNPGLKAVQKQLAEDYNFNDIELVLPTKLFDKQYTIDIEGNNIELIYVGPCHQVGDTIVYFPKEKVVFAGDVVFQNSIPVGWVGSYKNWFKCLDYIISLDPDVVVPGHGPICNKQGVLNFKNLLKHILTESKKYYDQGISSVEAAKHIDFKEYKDWKGANRAYMCIERAYREFSEMPEDTPWSITELFDIFYDTAKSRNIDIEF